jgi:MFS family permease
VSEWVALRARTSERPLAALWLGQALSAVGDRLHEVALIWIAVQAVGGRAGFVAGAGAVARLGVGLLGGVYADRWNRRYAMLAADVLRAVAVGSVALAAAFGTPSLWHLTAVAAAVGVLDSLFYPALQASLPALAPGPAALQRWNALLDLTPRLARAVAPSLTGALLALVPIEQFFAIDAVTYLASAAAIAALPREAAWRRERANAGRGAAGVARDIAGALALVRAHRFLSLGLAGLAAASVAWGTLLVGVPLATDGYLGGGAAAFGYVMGAYGAGNVVANLALATREVRGRARMLFAGGVVYGAGLLALAASPTLPVALGAAFCGALGGPMMDLMLRVIVQTEFPADSIGKIWSLRATVSNAGMSLGFLAAGPLYALASVPLGLACAPVLVLLLCGAGLLRFRDA